MSNAKKKARRSRDPEAVRRRLESSLPWSLSRWLARIAGRKGKRD
ncbi:MAG TPA: hypothetical protein PLN19_01650 [Methanothrix sp.]|nr:hypothetical protein [Methanothrix sp.]HPC89069.1 hypothetical protein [Methanothrix sp.]HQE86956.1 hypothetical protein [Methanothrix sp.]HQI68458.1 hypothetical protein [Methanothrix sp.]HRS84397.1 hypothetical protein [Methanothrix sp.]